MEKSGAKPLEENSDQIEIVSQSNGATNDHEEDEITWNSN